MAFIHFSTTATALVVNTLTIWFFKDICCIEPWTLSFFIYLKFLFGRISPVQKIAQHHAMGKTMFESGT
jgi:hypothetical protein